MVTLFVVWIGWHLLIVSGGYIVSQCGKCISSFAVIEQGMMACISQETAKAIDEELLAAGYSIEQLMELAGLAVAQSVYHYHAPCVVLVVCGPGNNGGDGLVAARHLYHFGFKVRVWYPKRGKGELFARLVRQLEGLNIEFVGSGAGTEEVIVDAVFGFSFTGVVREPFGGVLASMRQSGAKIVSVDIPSGWDVDGGPADDADGGAMKGSGDTLSVLQPDVLISLTAPKPCAKYHQGAHYLAGRFIPPSVGERYALRLPKYVGADQFVLYSVPQE